MRRPSSHIQSKAWEKTHRHCLALDEEPGDQPAEQQTAAECCSVGQHIEPGGGLGGGASPSLQVHVLNQRDTRKHSSFQVERPTSSEHFFSLMLHSFTGIRTSTRPSGTCGLPTNTEDVSRLFSIENIKTTPRDSFHKSCWHTGTRNRHPKTKSLSKNYQRGNPSLDSNLWACSSRRVSKLKMHLVISCRGKKSNSDRKWRGILNK